MIFVKLKIISRAANNLRKLPIAENTTGNNIFWFFDAINETAVASVKLTEGLGMQRMPAKHNLDSAANIGIFNSEFLFSNDKTFHMAKSAKKPIKKAVKKTLKKSVKKAAKKPVKNVSKKAVKKAAGKAANKSASKPTKRGKRFLILYHAPLDALVQTANVTPEQMAEGMALWRAWAERVGNRMVDLGAPLANGKRIHSNGSSGPSSKEVSGYSLVEAEDWAELMGLLEGHPHISGWHPDATIEVHETMMIPGM